MNYFQTIDSFSKDAFSNFNLMFTLLALMLSYVSTNDIISNNMWSIIICIASSIVID